MPALRPRTLVMNLGLVVCLSACTEKSSRAPEPPTVANTPPACIPSLVVPRANAGMPNGCFGTEGQSLEWAFEWTACANATQYELQVADPTGGLALSRSDLKTTSFRQDLTSLATTTYRRGWRWKVRANVSGAWGPWSPESAFDVGPHNVPYLVVPDENAVMDNGCTSGADGIVWDFAWTGCPNAPRYQLNIVAPTATISVVDERQTSDTSYRETKTAWTAQLTGWKWRVRAALPGGGYNDWSADAHFNVEPVNTDCR